ncbi:MAG: transcription antitermination factor NusB [Pontibacterium sp.]
MKDENPQPQVKGKLSKTEMRRSARSFALQALYQWQLTGHTMNEVEAQFRLDQDMAGCDLVMFGELLHGVNRHKDDLDRSFEPFLDRSLSELDPVELSVLRIGAFELKHRLNVPYRVAINESVELAKIYGATESHRYVNGVLDKLAQRARREEIAAQRNKS